MLPRLILSLAQPDPSATLVKLRDTPALQAILNGAEPGGVLPLGGVSQGAWAFLAAFLAHSAKGRPVLVVCPTGKLQEQLQQELETWLPALAKRSAKPPLFFPAWDVLPHEARLPHADVLSERLDEEKINFNQTLCKKISEKFPDSIDGDQNNDWIQLKPENWLKIAKWLRSDEELTFDSLQCNTGMDLGEGVLESRYNLHSMKHLHKVEIRIKVSAEKPDIPSVEQVWRVADWFERETYDMFGINFIGHRDLRRILLPDDWEGWPLRKDYEEQETYHGIIVPKVKEGWE